MRDFKGGAATVQARFKHTGGKILELIWRCHTLETTSAQGRTISSSSLVLISKVLLNILVRTLDFLKLNDLLVSSTLNMSF